LRSPHALTFVLLTVLIDTIGLGIVIPVLPELVMHLTGEGLSTASRWGGWLAFAYASMQVVFAPVIGGLSDRYGRRPVLLASLTAFGLDYLLMGWAPTLGWLFLGRMVAGMTGASYVTANAYVADVTTPDQRSQSFGLVGAMFGIGFIVGPALGGFLGALGIRAPFFAAAGLALVNVMYGAVVLPESLPQEHRRRFSLHPLQTLTTDRGPEQLEGAWAALTFETNEAGAVAHWLADRLGLRAFELTDADKALYHAGAAMASNFLVTLYRVSARLLRESGAPPEALVPLMRRVIENGFQLTGPIARGDWNTVDAHLAALRQRTPDLEPLYRALAEATRTIAQEDR